MIKINLLREKKAKKAPKGANEMAYGFAAIGVLAVGAYFFVHAPLVEEIDAQKAANDKVDRSVKQLKEATKDFDVVNQQYLALVAQEEAIQRLTNARAVPAWFIRELASILTKGRQPTMTDAMLERIATDPNRQWNVAWDPKRVWIKSVTEKAGAFTIEGGAQSDTDVTQLALRLQASVFFTDVVPEGGQSAKDSKSSVQFYNFKVTGKVVY